MSTLAERLAAGSERVASGCLEWQRATFGPNGYGAIGHEGRTIGAHRASYMVAVGPIPAGALVRHRCDNRRCIEPTHLVLGDYADNARDCTERGRRPTGEHNALAKLTDAQVQQIRDLYSTGSITQRELGRQFHVTQARIWQLVHNRSRTIPSPPPAKGHAVIVFDLEPVSA